MGVKNFSTADLYLASALTLFLGTPPQFEFSSGKILFLFEADDNLYRALDQYNAGVPLNAYLLSQTIKRLRGEMILRKNLETEQQGSRHE